VKRIGSRGSSRGSLFKMDEENKASHDSQCKKASSTAANAPTDPGQPLSLSDDFEW
jgi:hypothetical protein